MLLAWLILWLLWKLESSVFGALGPPGGKSYARQRWIRVRTFMKSKSDGIIANFPLMNHGSQG
jgi:hypothetical protein